MRLDDRALFSDGGARFPPLLGMIRKRRQTWFRRWFEFVVNDYLCIMMLEFILFFFAIDVFQKCDCSANVQVVYELVTDILIRRLGFIIAFA